MAEVVFKFDDEKEARDVEYVTLRNKIIGTLLDLESLSRDFYKGYIPDNKKLLIKDRKEIMTDEKIKKYQEECKKFIVEGTETYVSLEYVSDLINEILQNVRQNDLLD